MPYSGKRKFPYRLAIYVPSEKAKIVKNFIKVFRARNESASQKILSFIENYDNLVIFNREEIEEILALIKKEARDLAIQMLNKKVSAAGRVNPQTRINPQTKLSQYDSTLKPKPVLCGFGSRDSPCNKPAIAIAIHESGYEMLVCEKHMKELESEPKWRVKQI